MRATPMYGAGDVRVEDVPDPKIYLAVAPFVWAINTCDFCREGLDTSCRHGGQWGLNDVDGGQGEAVRVPQAKGTLVKLPVAEDAALLPSLLTLSDVFCTGHHSAVTAGVDPRTTVTVIGDGAVGLSAEGGIRLGRVFDRTVGLEGAPEGYRAMADREALKVLVRP